MSDDTLDEAWREAEAATPVGAILRLDVIRRRYEAFVFRDLDDRIVVIASASGDTAIAALRELVSAVRRAQR